MHLTGKQRRQLEIALLSAFPSRDALARMVAYQLDQNLAAIAGGDTLAAVVFNLVKWAHANGQIEQLISGDHAENPGNPELRTFVAQTATPSATQAPSATVNPTGPQDIYARYEAGVSELLRRMEQAHPRYGEALTYQQRLLENIAFARQFGDTETRQSDRAV
ncbi:MAG: effector-associated domain EAD1-containing protein, partial [Chloroflexaceae bacterium]